MKRFPMWMTALVFALALLTPLRGASAQGYVIVTNAAGPSTLSKDDVAKAFLKKSTRLVAVDQDKESRTRVAFTKAVLGRPLAAVLSYWQQQIFSGQDSPPVEKDSDEAVLAFVRGNPKAIGYVAAGTELGGGVRAVTMQ